MLYRSLNKFSSSKIFNFFFFVFPKSNFHFQNRVCIIFSRFCAGLGHRIFFYQVRFNQSPIKKKNGALAKSNYNKVRLNRMGKKTARSLQIIVQCTYYYTSLPGVKIIIIISQDEVHGSSIVRTIPSW